MLEERPTGADQPIGTVFNTMGRVIYDKDYMSNIDEDEVIETNLSLEELDDAEDKNSQLSATEKEITEQ